VNGELIAILDGRETGRIARDDRGKLSLRYNEAWRTAADRLSSIDLDAPPLCRARKCQDRSLTEELQD